MVDRRRLLKALLLAALILRPAIGAGGEPPAAAAPEDPAVRAEVLQWLAQSTTGNVAFAASKEAILKLGKAAEPALISRLAAKDTTERANAVAFLGLIKSEKSVSYFLAKKRDTEIAVRIAAIEALWCFQNPEHIRGLAESFLDDAHPSVRDVAVIVLGRYKDERAVPYLAKALDDRDDFARKCARKGLEDFSGVKVEGKTEGETNRAWKVWYEKWKKEHDDKQTGK